MDPPCEVWISAVRKSIYFCNVSVCITKREPEYTRVYPKVPGLSRKQNQQLVEKQEKGLWRQNSLD
jgi:hypothetical protein